MSRGTWTVALATLAMGTLAIPATAADLRVPQDFRTIRKAAKKAQPGDRIVLAPKTYRESVVLRVPNVTIEGNGAVWKPRRRNKPTLTIRADGVTVRGVEFWSGGVRGMGDDLAVESSRISEAGKRAAVELTGDGARVDQVILERHTHGKRTPASIVVTGDDAVVRDTVAQTVTESPKARPTGMDSAVVQITGEDAVVEANLVNSANVDAGIRIVGDDASATGNDTRLLPDDGLVIVGDRAHVDQHFAGNVQGTGVVVEGDSAAVTACGVDSTPDCIHVVGDDATVDGNDLRNGTGRGILVEGDGAQVQGNDLVARFGEGVTVDGDGFDITGNVFDPVVVDDPNVPPPPIADPVIGPPAPGRPDPGNVVPVAPECPMIVARTEAGGTIRGNDVEYMAGTAIHVEGDGVEIVANTALGTGAATSAIVVIGNDNVVLENETRTVSDFAIDVTGDGNMICTNRMLPAAGSTDRSGVHLEGDVNVVDENEFSGNPLFPGTESGDGFVIEGNRNDVLFNQALGAPGNGFLLEAGSGNEFVGNEADGCLLDGFCLMNGADNLVDQCRATGSNGQGLDNRAILTDVLNSWFQGNGGGDLVNSGTFDLFGSNEVGNTR